MAALSISSFSFLIWPRSSAAKKADNNNPPADDTRRKVVLEMIAAGTCESEYGVEMMMTVFPSRF